MAPVSEDQIRKIHDKRSLVEFLVNGLRWLAPPEVPTDDIFYDYTADELHLDKKVGERVRVQQLANFQDGQPWGIFLVEMNTPQIYTTYLRQILRSLAPNQRNRHPNQPVWNAENLLFVCTTPQYDRFTFAHFKGNRASDARIARFGWDKDELGLRTLREYNLPALEWPTHDNADKWLDDWASAFDVERVTKRFFGEYEEVFEWIKGQLRVKRGISRKLTEERRHEFTQRLMNRLLFLCFLQKKRWLDKNPRYLFDLYDKCAELERNFYDDYLFFVLFHGLNNAEGKAPTGMTLAALRERIGDVPFLNGGLFDEMDEWDTPLQLDFDNEIFDRLLGEEGLFRHYNFTVTESTPLDVQVALDPEMLGKVFEQLITKRRDKGSYYTPKTVVAFMCREALKKYLGGYETLVDQRSADQLTLPQAREILSNLAAVKVVDPACGSGAYLVGMLHELFDLTDLLETRVEQQTAQTAYQRKLGIIENNIYGVDIDEFAINIARLRLWLSLVIEYDGPKPLPLPNLDFKIEAGDSLTVPAPFGTAQPDLIRHQQIARFKQLKDAFLEAHGKREKDEKRVEIEEQRRVIKEYLYGTIRTEGFDWWVEFAEVFENGGFDVIVANPPYGATVEEKVRDSYFNPRNESEKGQSKDTYGLFIARALQLIREGGQFCFIVSDTWRTIRTHRPLRKRMLDTTMVHHVLDLPSWIFNATVNTCILTLTKSSAPADHKLVAGDLHSIKSGDWQTLGENLVAVAAHGVDVQTMDYAHYTYPQNLIATYDNLSFFIGSPRLYKLMSAKEFTRLVYIAHIKTGLQTGDNDYYIRKLPEARGGYDILDKPMLLLDSEIRELTSEEKLNGVNPSDFKGRHFVPYDKGGESDTTEGWLPNYFVPTQYFIDWSEKSVRRLHTATIADYKRRKGLKNKIEPSDETKIAAVIRSPQYYFRSGLTASRVGLYSPTFRFTTGGPFDSGCSNLYSDSMDSRYLCGILASRLHRYFFIDFLNHTVNSQVDDLKDLPIVMEGQHTTEIISFVDQIIEKQKVDPRYSYHLKEQKEIDALVYQLYGLDENDIREVELWYCRRYPKLAEAQGVMSEIHQKYASYLDWAENIQRKPPHYWSSHPTLRLIAQGEGSQLELKETLEADAATGTPHQGVLQSALKTVAAFLNTDGGTLLVGVSDVLEIKGLDKDYRLIPRRPNADGLENKLRNLLETRFDPAPLGKVDIHFDHLPDGTVCRIEVQRSASVIHYDNAVYIRDGNRTIKLEGRTLTDWIERRNRG